MRTQNTLIRCKGFDISIGRRIDQVALISHHTGEFVPFTAIKKGGRLAKIRRIFRRKLSSSTHFFFEGIDDEQFTRIKKILS